MRLMVPLLIAIPLLLIPRLYMGQEFEEWTRLSDDYIEPSFWVYAVKVIPHVIDKMSWLWFLPLLFVVSVLSYPAVAWMQRRAKKIDIDFKEDGKLLLAQFAIFVKLNIISIAYCT